MISPVSRWTYFYIITRVRHIFEESNYLLRSRELQSRNTYRADLPNRNVYPLPNRLATLRNCLSKTYPRIKTQLLWSQILMALVFYLVFYSFSHHKLWESLGDYDVIYPTPPSDRPLRVGNCCQGWLPATTNCVATPRSQAHVPIIHLFP